MKYDLIVIGGGAAGMMAAGRAAERGFKVLLLEKKPDLANKLLITGKGRCNITHNDKNYKRFIKTLGHNGEFLFKALYNFGIDEIKRFFEDRGLSLKVERGQRVFPQSDKAADVVKVLLEYLKENQVDIKTKAEVKNFKVEDKKILKVVLADETSFEGRNFLIATGGKSYSGTGSTGDAYKWLENMGHKIIKPRPALTPIVLDSKWIQELEGLSLKNVKISIWQNNKKADERFGEALFTHYGMSGPIILDMSAKIGDLLDKGPVDLKIDFKPALDYPVLDKRLQKDFQKYYQKSIKNYFKTLLPQSLISVFIAMLSLSGENKVETLRKEDRKALLHLLKEFSLPILSLSGFNKAIITLGGVDVSEIDPNTMKSKIISNLYLAGELLDIAGPTGGYNLQIAWSTAYLSADSLE